jgi:hypothetical protein
MARSEGTGDSSHQSFVDDTTLCSNAYGSLSSALTNIRKRHNKEITNRAAFNASAVCVREGFIETNTPFVVLDFHKIIRKAKRDDTKEQM